jgi:hypothetical protein
MDGIAVSITVHAGSTFPLFQVFLGDRILACRLLAVGQSTMTAIRRLLTPLWAKAQGQFQAARASLAQSS